jgi:hypothetical protein
MKTTILAGVIGLGVMPLISAAADNTAREEVKAAFAKLDAGMSYRMKMSPVMKSSSQQMGGSIQPFVREVSRSGVSRTVMDMSAQDISIHLQNVIKGDRIAVRIDSDALNPQADQMKRMMAQMMVGMLSNMGEALASGAFSGPYGALSLASSLMAAMTLGRMTTAVEQLPVGEWKCRKTTGKPVDPSTVEITALGRGKINGNPTLEYELKASSGSQHLYVSQESGLPLRVEVANASGAPSMIIEYQDYGAPIRIETPACL